MKEKIAALAIALLLLTGAGAPAEAGGIEVTIKGIRTPEGRVFVGLFRPADDFPRQDRTYQGVALNADDREVAARLADVPDGTYAVAVYHDANSNGILDRNFFGVPREDYGFSNNARGSLGAPRFEKAAFEHKGTTRIAIDLNP